MVDFPNGRAGQLEIFQEIFRGVQMIHLDGVEPFRFDDLFPMGYDSSPKEEANHQ